MELKTLFIEQLGWDNLTQTLTIALTEPGQLLLPWGNSARKEDTSIAVRRFSFLLEGIAVKRGLPVFVCSPYKQGKMPSFLMRCEITRRICGCMTHALLIFRSAIGQQIWQWRRLRDDGTELYCEHTLDSLDSPDARTLLAPIVFRMEEEDRVTLADVLHRVEEAFGFDRVRQTKHRLRLNEMDLSGESDWLQGWVNMAYRRRGVALFEERRLITAAQKGDPTAQQRLVEAHLYLPLEMGWKRKERQELTMPLEDLVHEGYFGLLDAVRTYTFHEEKRFQAHAAFWVRRNMDRAILRCAGLIHYPYYIHDEYADCLRDYNLTEDRLTQLLERPPTPHELAKALGIPAAKLPLVRQMRAGVRCVGIAFEEANAPSFEALMGELLRRGADKREHITSLMATLNDKQSDVVRLRFGLDNAGEYTLEEVGQKLGVTRERVRQIEFRALQLMREAAKPPDQHKRRTRR